LPLAKVMRTSDENNCRATASVARQAMRLPYKFRVNTRIR
jgi:hypothetical protein